MLQNVIIALQTVNIYFLLAALPVYFISQYLFSIYDSKNYLFLNMVYKIEPEKRIFEPFLISAISFICVIIVTLINNL
jgi:hypothetical protein